MYTPSTFQVSNQALILSFIDRYDFATLVTLPSTGGVCVTHVPLLLDRSGGRPVLVGHLARANEHWRHFDGNTASVAIFHGPHGYVSPNWYESKPAVPTWNYAVVHAHGCPRVMGDPNSVSNILEALVEKNESHRPDPWSTRELPADFSEHMRSQIVAFEMPIDRFESKFKLGQNRSREDREGTIRGLVADGSPGAAALADFMQNSFIGK
jgi:transcriptional regulator